MSGSRKETLGNMMVRLGSMTARLENSWDWWENMTVRLGSMKARSGSRTVMWANSWDW
jgi:hypothetical protein